MLSAAFLLLASPALAQQSCVPWRDAFKTLIQMYGEHPLARATTSDGKLLWLLVDPNDRSFTILLIDENGNACPGTAGEDFEMAPNLEGNRT